MKPNGRRAGTRCKRCVARALAQDPAVRAKAGATIREVFTEDRLRKRGEAVSRQRRARIATDPAFAAKVREAGRQLGLAKLGASRHGPGSPVRMRAGEGVSNRRLAWCPPEYRDIYRFLLKEKHVPAAEARRMVEDQMRHDGVEQIHPNLPPFKLLHWSNPDAAAAGSARLAAAIAAALERGQ
jgi:hypothetical protein